MNINNGLDAYLAIETAGWSHRYAEITVMGIRLVDSSDGRLVRPAKERGRMPATTLGLLVQRIQSAATIALDLMCPLFVRQ